MTATGSGVAVIGAGSWGTTLAIQIARGAGAVRLWGRDASLVSTMQATRENPRYLPGIALSAGVRATTDHAEALRGADLVLVAVPSHFVRATLGPMVRAVPPGAAVLSATKGFEPGTALRMSELLAELLPEHPVAALSGPSFAREVAGGKPAALVVASPDPAVARQLQERLTAPAFRLYTNRDLVGVEIGGALKNVMAIATGLSDGLGLGENARAALVTRGLAEIGRLALASGGQAATLAGLAGLGDLVLTCTGAESRNHRLGLAVANGRTLAEAEGATRMVAEGVRTVSSARILARRAEVSMPICDEVSAVLFEGKPVREALASLLAREPRPEEEQAVRA
ncbi:MAG TPA: NAD(P)H-dependent glycerol-3-phosphate dehydrogenase [Methylomirabilota bacterium]|jgi:glycerol-3-phosphate dehydrogenase (NAD(P)+)|nr:NAD(P)H-dependent glycerol-3-phosphate dehydrogenase [Methylomirabilota bacterium]